MVKLTTFTIIFSAIGIASALPQQGDDGGNNSGIVTSDGTGNGNNGVPPGENQGGPCADPQSNSCTGTVSNSQGSG
ncbi:hypothetical protein V8F20_012799 [Naviculisporaceae sp. PSN 640]